MNIAICTNISNFGIPVGLAREFELLRDHLQGLGHAVVGLQYDAPAPADLPKLDLMISLETISRELLSLAPQHWWFPNPEWTYKGYLDLARRQFSKILCKTKEGERIFNEFFPDITHYVGFLTRDQYDKTILRKRKFLHIGGNSSFRGTQAVLDAWKWKRNGQSIGAELIIVSKALQDLDPVPGVTVHERLSDEEIKLLQNECLFHLYPSGTEGFGHALHEALGVNAVLVTTDAPPMNEIYSALKIPSVGKTVYNLADVYEVSALDIFSTVRELMATYPYAMPADFGREELLEDNERFGIEFNAHLDEFKPQTITVREKNVSGKLRIAFLGNFDAQESTENQVKWALERGLGHEVEPIQENRASLDQLEGTVRFCDLFLWVRTPGWLQISDVAMIDFIGELKAPSVSLHLDKFWGIPEREALIGVHPFWKTDMVFTADGSRQEDFAKRGVKHHWMHPAVSEVYIHPGSPRKEYLCDVGFVGAKGYHQEYPFRGRLIEFLEQTYRGRFRHIEGVRGHTLNDAYASMSIVVGDCFQAGTPRYWSDRLPETYGRYGFLLHPAIEGVTIPTACYKPQDLDSLKWSIDYWLPRESERWDFVKFAAKHVRENDTWTVRMEQILKTVLAS